MKSIRKRFFFGLLICFCFSGFAIENKFEFSCSVPFTNEKFDDFFDSSITYSLIHPKNEFLVSMQTTKTNFSLLFDDTFWIYDFYSKKNKENPFVKLGAKSFFSSQLLNTSSFFHNIAIGLESDFFIKKYLSIYVQLLYDYNFGRVFLNQSSLPLTWNNFLGKVGVDFQFPFFTPINVFFEMTNFTYHKINKFYSPIFIFGVGYVLNEEVKFGLKADFNYIDLFTYSRYFDYLSISLSGEILF